MNNPPSIENACVICPICGREEIELPVVSGLAVGMCTECYSALSLPVFRCKTCGEMMGLDYASLDTPGDCLFCVSGD